MKKIALATAALLIASGSAFAENPNASYNQVSPQTVDSTYTASVNAGTQSNVQADQTDKRLNTSH